jgi:choline dehydrogenase-like flavoprotein
MNNTKQEIIFKNYLFILSIIFLLGCILISYFFIFAAAQQVLLFVLTSPLLLILFILSKLASGGIRKNNSFSCLLIFSFLVVGIYSLVRVITSAANSQISLIYILYFLISSVLFLLTLILWRKSVISRFDLKTLSPTEALSYKALAEVVIGDYKTEGYSFDTTVKDFDKYLSIFDSSKKSSAKMVYLAAQFLPLIFFNLPLSWMGIEERKDFIQKRFFKATGLVLTIMRSAKQLVYFVYYGNKPSFKSTGYKLFEDRERFNKMPKEPDPEPLDIKYITNAAEIQTDICVIGSGAAGAVEAYNLAKNTGKKVTILEKGKYYIPQKDFTNIESEMIGMLYKDGALELTQDFDLAILQGNCVGGSTVINNGICFRTPASVLNNWEKIGAKIDSDKLEKYFDSVENIIGSVSLVRNPPITNEGANRFYKGAENLNLNPEWFKTNFGTCGGSGYCNIGCKYNRKLSMLLNYLPLAQKEGVEIIADCEVLKIQTRGKNAEKIICKNSSGTKFTISAKQVVVAAGAIASSSILLKSGIKKNVGTRLSFNITTPMMAEFPDVVNSFDGVQMCCYIKGNGFLVETTFNPPGTSALIMQGWFEKLNERMKIYTHFATAAPVVGSEPNGAVKLDLFGNTTVDYKMTNGDFQKLKEGMKTLCKIFLAANADCVLPSSYDEIVIKSEKDLGLIDNMVKKPEDISLSTAHPQGGNPLSDNKEIGAVDSNFRVHGFNNLYVCDASVFPTGVMVNPQLSIMGIANYAADIISSTI